MNLKWDPVNEANRYKIYWQKEDEKSASLLASISQINYTITLTNKEDFVKDITFLVSAVVKGVEGEKASIVALAPPPPPPWY